MAFKTRFEIYSYDYDSAMSTMVKSKLIQINTTLFSLRYLDSLYSQMLVMVMMFTGANEVDQRVICYRNCDVGCGTNNACHERCKKRCGYPPSMLLHL